MFQETPFVRTICEVKNLSNTSGLPPTRFVGVCRVSKTLSNGKTERSFGVAIPQFYVDRDSLSVSKSSQEAHLSYTRNGHIVPREATVRGQLLLLRVGIDDEKVAGQFFAFMYRIMYGAKAVLDVLAEDNQNDMLSTFGMNQMPD